MNEQTSTTENTEAPAVTKTVIRPDLTRYVPAKSSGGKRSHRKDDLVARCLAGKSLEEVKNGGAAFGIDADKWAHLNPGQQRMLVGNALRSQMNAKKDPLTAAALTVVFGEPVPEFDPAAAAAEAEAKAQAKADAKAAKEAAAKEAAEKAAARAAAIPPAEAPAPVVDEEAAEKRVEEGRKSRREARSK